MASYGIFRVEKLKKVANLKGSLMHAFREQETPNADPEKRATNILLTPDTYNVETTLEKYNKLKPTGKIRSDVVHAIEVLVTASPEKIKDMSDEERSKYFNEALAFCNKEFGDKNLLHAQIHNDETTAHLTAFYIPVIEKTNKKGVSVRKLNASSLLGGKKDYSKRQTDFYEQVSKKYGLERGEIGSKATHKKVLDWYSELNASDNVVDDLIKDLENKKNTSIKFDVDVPKIAVLGFNAMTEKETKVVNFNCPMLRIDDVKSALKLRMNSNSEMIRRQKKAYKAEVRREVEEEVNAKLKAKYADLEVKEKNMNNIVANVRDFYNRIASKLGIDVRDKSYPEKREAIINKIESNAVLVKENLDALELKNEVYSELSTWINSNDERVFMDFNDYKNAFRRYLNEVKEKRKDINKLLDEKEELKSSLGKSREDVFSLKSLTDKISNIVKDFFDGNLIKTIEGLVSIAKKARDPDFIREEYYKHCEKLFETEYEIIKGYLSYALDCRNSSSERINAYNSAVKKYNDFMDYTQRQIPEFTKLFEEVGDEVKRLNNYRRMRM